jgi:hypothetical protein
MRKATRSSHPHTAQRYLQCQPIDGHHADNEFLLDENVVVEEQQTKTIDHFDDHFGIMLTKQNSVRRVERSPENFYQASSMNEMIVFLTSGLLSV